MGTRITARYILRRFSSNGNVLNEEEKAAENVYIKKMEQEKLKKLAYKGPKPEEQTSTGSSGSASLRSRKLAGKISTSKSPNYAVMVGIVTVFGTLGWYLNSSDIKTEKSL